MESVVLKLPAGRLCIKHALCPNGCSLINPKVVIGDKPAITALVRFRGQQGQIHLSPFFGKFEHKSDLKLKKGDLVDLFCPHCGTSLSVAAQCGICKVPMFALQLPSGGEIRACPTVGCHNHELTIVDLDAQFASFYDALNKPIM